MFGNTKYSQEYVDGLSKQISDLNAVNTRLEASFDEANTTIEELAVEKEQLTKQITNFQTDLKALNDKHKVELTNISNSVNKKVNSALAAIGVDVFANDNFSVKVGKSDKELLTQFNGFTDPAAKTEFYNKNKVAISRALLS